MIQCPVFITEYPYIQLAHGGGGKLMQDLIERIFISVFGNRAADQTHDASRIGHFKGELAFTTDSYVVNPMVFPGGDIGSLAVYGTVNDLAMAGARPLYLSAAFILEEGLLTETLWRIVLSMKQAADRAGVRIVTGDTKVVDRGKADGIFITTSGVGEITHSLRIHPLSVCERDAVLVNGDLGRHGMAVMAEREGLRFETDIRSDSQPLWEPVKRLIEAGIHVHCLRDLTRGGLASVLNEISEASGHSIQIREQIVPVNDQVKGACEVLGLDPLYVANEGRFVLFVPAGEAQAALQILKNVSPGSAAAIIGEVKSRSDYPRVSAENALGSHRLLDWLSGEQLPRIC